MDRVPVMDAQVVPDAPPIPEIPDITGSFLLGIAPGFAPQLTILIVADNTLTQNGDGTATLTAELQPLSVMGKTPVGDPIQSMETTVNAAGQFTMNLENIMVDGAANPISGSDLVLTIVFDGTIRDEDLYCGTASGSVTSPAVIDLTGTTWGAIRITPGTTGDDLPPSIAMCPAMGDIDAGVPDAGAPVDAGVADAAITDAAPTDV